MSERAMIDDAIRFPVSQLARNYSSKRLQNILYRIANSLFGWAFGFEVTGQAYIPRKGGAIIASNHVSYLDPPLLGAASTRELFYMARDTLFKPKLAGDIISYLNAFPVKRGKPDRRALKNAIDITENGKLLLVFPEGTRSYDGTLGEPHLGVGFIIYHSKVPVIPAYVNGAEDSMPRGGGIKRAKISVHFGKPVPVDDLRRSKSRDVYMEIGRRVMEGIGELQRRYWSKAGVRLKSDP